jgi:hypothetical protein
MANNRIRFSNDFILKDEKIGINTTDQQSLLDVGGSVNISENLVVSGISTFDSKIGIGTTNPTEELDISGNIKVSGLSSTKNLYVSGVSTIGLTSTRNLYVAGVSTIGLTSSRDLFVSGVSTIGLTSTQDLFVSGISTVGFITAQDLIVAGVSTVIGRLSVGLGETIISTTLEGNVGLGSTLPQQKLDIAGSIKLDGAIYDSENSKGELDQLLFSTGDGTGVLWKSLSITGIAGAIDVKIPTSVDSYYITGTKNISGLSSVAYVDPEIVLTGDNKVGIGTTMPTESLDVDGNARFSGTLYVKDVITTGSAAQDIVRTSSGIITTNSLNPIPIDFIGINTYRSAKYITQITSRNSLKIGGESVSNLNSGNDYYPGVYSDVPLEVVTGEGQGAEAQITVLPKVSRTLSSSSNGIFTISGTFSGLTEGQTLFFDKTLTILPLEQSKLTGIQVNSSGFGYTSFPKITIGSPIISGNPVEGVSTGSTATAIVNSMNVQGAIVTSGVSTTIIPTVQFSAPSTGTTATGIVGFGVSTITVNNIGSGYTASPQISIPKVTGFAATVGMGISSLNWQTVYGSNYTSPTITVNPVGGIGTGAVIEADVDTSSPNGLINFRITNPGFGYTTPPIVIITDATGVGAAVTINRLTVSNVSVNNIGSGATTTIQSSDIILSPINSIGSGAVLAVNEIVPTNALMTSVGSGYTSIDLPVVATFSNTSILSDVSLGVETISITSTGIGYTQLPSLTFASPTLGIGSTATGSSTKLGYDQITLNNGPGFGGLESVYYIKPLSSNTFSVSLTSGGDVIPFGYTIPTNTTVSVGGIVSNVSITYAGSNYEVNDIITATNFDSSRIDTNTGSGFSFTVSKVVDNFQISDLLLLQTADSGNTFAYVVENSGLADVVNLGNFTADIDGDNARLIFNPVFPDNELKYFRTAFVI